MLSPGGSPGRRASQVAPRVLRVEFNGMPYDWLNLGEMGKNVMHSEQFVATLRENIVRYFKVPLEVQVCCDEDGPLVCPPDYLRVLRSVSPFIRIFDMREMPADMKMQVSKKLAAIQTEVAKLQDGISTQNSSMSPWRLNGTRGSGASWGTPQRATSPAPPLRATSPAPALPGASYQPLQPLAVATPDAFAERLASTPSGGSAEWQPDRHRVEGLLPAAAGAPGARAAAGSTEGLPDRPRAEGLLAAGAPATRAAAGSAEWQPDRPRVEGLLAATAGGVPAARAAAGSADWQPHRPRVEGLLAAASGGAPAARAAAGSYAAVSGILDQSSRGRFGGDLLEVKLRRTADQKFGFGIEPMPDGKAATIDRIDPDGILDRWNGANPKSPVVIGDKLLTVNGVMANLDAMEQELRTMEIKMQLEPCRRSM